MIFSENKLYGLSQEECARIEGQRRWQLLNKFRIKLIEERMSSHTPAYKKELAEDLELLQKIMKEYERYVR